MRDYTLAIKNKGRPPKSWRWEIYEAGKNKPVRQSEFFETIPKLRVRARLHLQNSGPTGPLDALTRNLQSFLQ